MGSIRSGRGEICSSKGQEGKRCVVNKVRKGRDMQLVKVRKIRDMQLVKSGREKICS